MSLCNVWLFLLLVQDPGQFCKRYDDIFDYLQDGGNWVQAEEELASRRVGVVCLHVCFVLDASCTTVAAGFINHVLFSCQGCMHECL